MRLVAAARDTTESAGVAALVEEIFTGRSARPLPRCVAEALDALERRPANITAADAVQR